MAQETASRIPTESQGTRTFREMATQVGISALPVTRCQ